MKKYEEIMHDITKKIDSGIFSEGSKIPSVNKSAEYYQCAPETVVKAYRELVNQHILYVKKHSGHYVGQIKADTCKEKKFFNLSTGNIEISRFPIIESQTNLLQGIKKYGQQTLNYKPSGVESLIEALSKHLQNMNLFVKSDNIYVTQGVHQAFVTICQHLLPEDKKILIENPAYSFANDFLKYSKLPVVTIQRDVDGFSIENLEKIFKTKEIGLFFLNPRYHNPLGTTLPKKQIRAIAKLAEKYQVFIIEDDYFADGTNQKSYETIFENTRSNCFYLSTFTKVTPYLRTGFMILPDGLRDRWGKIIQTYHLTGYFAPSLIAQSALEAMINNGTLQKYKETSRKENEKKQLALKNCVKNWKKELAYVIPKSAGHYRLILFHPSISIETLLKKLLQKNIFAVDGKQSFYDENHPYYHSIRISLSQLTIREIPLVLDIIYQEALQIYKIAGNEK